MDSPSHGYVSPVAQSSTPSRPADKGPSCKGPGTSSPDGTAKADWPCSSPGALDSAEEARAPGYHSQQIIDQSQLQQPRPQQPDLQQRQLHGLMPAPVSGDDGDRQRLRQVAASQGQEEPFTDEEDQADSGSELSECESAGAVGDDELLDHEFDITDAEAQRAPADQPQNNGQPWPDTKHSFPSPCGHNAEQDCAVSSTEMPAHSSIVTQHQQMHPIALPQHFGNQSFGEQQRAAEYPQQWPNQAMAPMVRHRQMQPGLGRGRPEEHVYRGGSKLREAYRGHCQQDHQRQAEAEQQLAQHGQRQNSGNAS